MLRASLTLVVLLLAGVASAVGCDDDADPHFVSATTTPEPTPTIEAPPQVMTPEPAAGYPWTERLDAGAGIFVYDVTAETIQALVEGGGARTLGWAGDEAILISLGDRPLLLELDGTLRRWDEPLPTATPFPLSETASNGWIAEVATPTGPGDAAAMLVRDDRGRTVYRISEANVPRWSADGSRLTFLGNICSGWDQMLLDVRSGELENVTPGIGDWLTDSSHGPQASMVTLPVYRNAGSLDGTTRTIDLLDMTTGTLRRLITIPGSGSLHIIGWNPSDTRLLFSFTRSGKSHLCERPPTTVERVNG